MTKLAPSDGRSAAGVAGAPAAVSTLPELPPVRPRAVTPRSFGIGLLVVAFISALAPYQQVIRGTGIEGSYLPIISLLAIAIMVVVNGLLARVAPARRFTAGEMAVVLAMILAAAGVVNVGLFRQLPGNLVGMWFVANENSDWERTLNELGLPDWMFPAMAGETVDDRQVDRVVQDYIGRTPLDDRGFASQWFAVPWRAWLTPAVSWGALMVCVWGATLCLIIIFRRQWVENERLPFPIATIYLSLIEPPEAGRAFNAVLRSRWLWIGFAAVFTYNALYGLHVYDPKHFPEVPRGYDFRTLFANPPWSFTLWGFKEQPISFTMIAICLFITTKVSFSIWFFYVALNAARMYLGSSFQRDVTEGMGTDQTMGAFLAYGMAMLYVARHHLKVVLLQMVRGGARDGEPRGRYAPYVLVGWALVAFAGGMVAWLMTAGATLVGAALIATWVLFVFLGLARLVAETGLVFVVFTLSINRWFIYALQDLPRALAGRTTAPTYFLSALGTGVFLQDLGHSYGPQAATTLRVADSAGYERETNWRRAAPLLGCIAVALAVAYVVAGAGTLHMQYNHAVTLDREQVFPNDWGTLGMPRWFVLNPTAQYLPPNAGPVETHDRLGHFAFGAFVTAACSALRLRYDWWPLHPVGFLIVYGWGINRIWFSIFTGWLIKVLIVRFGGASMLRGARPLFIGLILGEAGAAVMWLAVNMARLSMGLDYTAISVR